MPSQYFANFKLLVPIFSIRRLEETVSRFQLEMRLLANFKRDLRVGGDQLAIPFLQVPMTALNLYPDSKSPFFSAN